MLRAALAAADNWRIFGCNGSRYQCSPQYEEDGRSSVYYDELEPGKAPKATMSGFAANFAQWPEFGPSWKPSCVSPKAFDTIAAAKRRLARE